MDNLNTATYDIYQDICQRTKGDIYIGVVGPVRTGKSTFIKRFMDLLVIPNIKDEHSKERTVDELPQSAQGKTIMTTEPKFVPKEAAAIQINEDVSVNVRLIDCVGFMVEGAFGHQEDGSERLVKTPWLDYEIPFTQAAEIGTQKVIREHANIGIVITTDGAFTEIPREHYIEAEEHTVAELKKIGKPFIILLNTERPYSTDSIKLAEELQQKYQVSTLPVNCQQLKKEDIHKLLESVLYEFPISRLEFYMPRWIDMLSDIHVIKENILENAKAIMDKVTYIKDLSHLDLTPIGSYVSKIKLEDHDLATGTFQFALEVAEEHYYQYISDMVKIPIQDEYQLLTLLQELADMRKEYSKVSEAMESVRIKGYGVVTPHQEEIEITDPILIRHGNKFGVKLRALSPSIHMIRANIETEIAPIIGNQEQAEDLIAYLKETKANSGQLFDSNIFGKSIGELVEDGIRSKITLMDDVSQQKLQDSMKKIVNDNTGGMVCIII